MITRNLKESAANGYASDMCLGVIWPQCSLLPLTANSQVRKGLSHGRFQTAHPIFMVPFPGFAASHAQVTLSALLTVSMITQEDTSPFLQSLLIVLVIHAFLACSSLVPIKPPHRHAID